MFRAERNSIRGKLFISISLVILTSLALIYSLGFFNTKKEIQEFLDVNMAKTGKLILSLMHHELEEGEQDGFLDDFEDKISLRILHEYEKQIHIQVWKDDDLVYVSDRELLFDIPEKEGFEDFSIKGEDWRGFTLFDLESEVKVLILEQHQIRSELIWKILASPFIPLGISSLMMLLIWLCVDKKIGALNILSKKIANIPLDKLAPFNDRETPLEIKPLVGALNNLIVRLSESMQMERRFTDYAAHELRTPLAVIKTHVQLLIKDKKKAQDDEYLSDLEKAVDRMIHLVNQVLVLVRLEPEDLNIEREILLFSDVVKYEIANFESAILQKNITVNFSCENERPYRGNRTYLEIMVSNLLDNALKYSFENSEIKIDLIFSKQKILFKISNLGNFIEEDQAQKIFDVFYRVNSGAINNSGGCGLGMAIVQKVTRLHNAQIGFNSKKIDEEKSLNEVEVIFKN